MSKNIKVNPKKNWIATSSVSKIIDGVDPSFRNNYINDAILFFAQNCNIENYSLPIISAKTRGRPRKISVINNSNITNSIDVKKTEKDLCNIKANLTNNNQINEVEIPNTTQKLIDITLTETTTNTEDNDKLSNINESENPNEEFNTGSDGRFQ